MKSAFRLLTVVVLLAAVASCVPLPIPHTELATPKGSGILTHSDGTPMVGAVVAVTNEGRDVACQKFAVRDTTDAHGRFELPTINEHRRVLYVSMIENFGQPWYELCVQPSDSLSRAKRYARTSVVTHRSGGSIRCLEWAADAQWYLTCEDALHQAIAEGGRWTDGKTRGTYRLINADPIPFESALAVQWIADSTSDGPAGSPSTGAGSSSSWAHRVSCDCFRTRSAGSSSRSSRAVGAAARRLTASASRSVPVSALSERWGVSILEVLPDRLR